MVDRCRPVLNGTAFMGMGVIGKPNLFEASGGEFIPAHHYDALAADLAEVRSDRQREHDLRVLWTGHAEAFQARVHDLEAALRSHKDFQCTCGFAVDHVLTRSEIKYTRNGTASCDYSLERRNECK